jgi:hypothetical protein
VDIDTFVPVSSQGHKVLCCCSGIDLVLICTFHTKVCSSIGDRTASKAIIFWNFPSCLKSHSS